MPSSILQIKLEAAMSKKIRYEAFLKLDAGTHTARINQLLVTPDGKTLITSGGDKTIRVWDVETKKQTGMLLGQIGDGSDGRIQAVSLSRDGLYLAVLAWMNPPGTLSDVERETDVRVYELATGNLQAGFRYKGTLQDLDFSPDDRFLAIVGNPIKPVRCGYVMVFDTQKILHGFGKLPAPITSATLYDNDTLIPSYVRFIPKLESESEYRLVAATWQHHKWEQPEYTGELRWYSLSPSSKRLKLNTSCETDGRYYPVSLTVSSKFVVVTGEQKVLVVHDHEGKLVTKVVSESVPAQPAFSKDERQLIVGQKGDSALVQVKAYDTALGQFPLRSTYYGHDSEVVAVALLPDGTAVSAGGDQNAIHFWSTEHMEGELGGEITGVGRVVHAVGINADEQIGIGNHDSLQQEDGSIVIQRMFDLHSMTLKSLSTEAIAAFRRAQTQYDERQLEWIEADGFANLYLLPDQMPFTGIPQVGWYYASTYGFTERGTVVTGANDGRIRVAPRGSDGNYQPPERNLVGHAARVIDHAACGKWLVTAGSDQIIRLWYLDDVEENVMTDLAPALNLFVGADDEWVIWSESGYYNASQRGDRRFGYHVNRGSDKEALYFPSDRFIKAFFRPDIIDAIVECGSEKRAIAKLAEQGHPIAPVDVARILPPIVELTKNGVTITPKNVTFSFTVEALNPQRPVKRVWVVRNDQFVWESEKLLSKYKVTVPLVAGSNRFKIIAENESTKAMPLIFTIAGPAPRKGGGKSKAESAPLSRGGTITARGSGPTANVILGDKETGIPDNGTLYLLAIGVSDLKMPRPDKNFNSLRFAHTDAISIYNAFAKTKLSGNLDLKAPLRNKAFQSVEATILLNEKATKKGILDAVDKICEKIKKKSGKGAPRRDVLFVFLSGHGIRRTDPQTHEQELYFWNYDLDFDNTRRTGLSLMEIGQKITSIPADVILTTDACHSGMAGSDVVKGLDPNELAKRIYAINERGMYILNAARSDEYALESGRQDIQHGIFTKSVLETLELEPNVDMMTLIASVQQRVQYYTNRAQTPICRMYGDLLPLTVYEK
jgi:WD40 repeat protein